MVKRKPILTSLLLGVLLLVGAVQARAATISVQSDRDPVSLNASFHLVFSAAGSVDGDPDFGPLKKNFQILDQSQSSEINIINGHYSHTTRWTLDVMAKRAGDLTIPPIHFGSDLSAAGSVTVTRTAAAQAGASGGDRNLFLQVTATPKNPYVQAQVIYTVRLYRAVDLESATLSAPKLTGGDAVIEKLGKAVQYQTRRNGRRYAVIERKYAIFPQQSGAVTIAPVVFQGKVVEDDPIQLPGGNAIDQFNNFFNHFGTMFPQQAVRTERLASSPVSLRVRPIPAAFKGGTWLPAKALHLRSSWSGNPPRWAIGAPVTRTLTLRAAGLTAAQLPKLAPPLQAGLKQYPDEPSLKQQKQPTGVIGTRVEKVAIMPAKAGTYTLPAVTVPWWNTTTDRMEIARLPARVIHVAGGAASTPAAASPPAVKSQPPASRPHPAASAPAHTAEGGGPPWFWVSLLLAVGWAASVVALALVRGKRRKRMKRRKKKKARPPKSPPSPWRTKPAEAWQRLQQACAGEDPGAAKEALLAWARLRWPQQAPATLEDVGACCGAAAAEEIRSLSAHLYGRGGAGPWAGESLRQALEKVQAEEKTDDRSAAEDLEPLYKL